MGQQEILLSRWVFCSGLIPMVVRQLFWMYYICNWNDRSSVVICNLAINRKVGFSFRLQENNSLLKQ